MWEHATEANYCAFPERAAVQSTEAWQSHDSMVKSVNQSEAVSPRWVGVGEIICCRGFESRRCSYWAVLCSWWIKKHLEENCVDLCSRYFTYIVHCVNLPCFSLPLSAVNKMIKEHGDLFSDSQCKVCSAVLISASQKLTHYQVSEPTLSCFSVGGLYLFLMLLLCSVIWVQAA